MFTLGTAGHVDHGKSTLVQSLTGMDPDRLREEKARGLTIVPGYTWLTLPSGREVSIVDVPGHAKFIKNMLTGVASIDLAILVVAANESIMPQTTEHLSILELLNIKACIPVITKADLVDQDLLELVDAEFGDLLGTSSVDYSHIIRVSSITGAGIQGLISQIDTLLGTCNPKQDLNAPRLVVDRSFSASGYGTIVTGTLIEGRLSTGQSVELPIAKENARINEVEINFLQQDILQTTSLPKTDVIVSNPPYVLESEKEKMQANVLEYEPNLALFVADNDPLIFYKKIGALAEKSLNCGGKLYFEINEQYGAIIPEMLSDIGFVDIALKKDINDKDRLVKAIWK